MYRMYGYRHRMFPAVSYEESGGRGAEDWITRPALDYLPATTRTISRILLE